MNAKAHYALVALSAVLVLVERVGAARGRGSGHSIEGDGFEQRWYRKSTPRAREACSGKTDDRDGKVTAAEMEAAHC